MTYWIRWQATSGDKGPRIGPFAHRHDAERHMQDTLRAWATDLEGVAGTSGVWTADGELYSDDMFHDETPIGKFVIEEEPDDAPSGPER